MSVVRCGNRECKELLKKSDAVSNGFSYYCDSDCMFAAKKKAFSGMAGRHSSSSTKQRMPAETAAYVLERDGFSCRICGRSNPIEIHHIIYRSTYSNKKWENEPWNLIVLCSDCHHNKVHNRKDYWQPRLLGLTWLSEVARINLSVEKFEEEYEEILGYFG